MATNSAELCRDLELLERSRKRYKRLGFAFGLSGVVLPFVPVPLAPIVNWQSVMATVDLSFQGLLAFSGGVLPALLFVTGLAAVRVYWLSMCLGALAGFIVVAHVKKVNAARIAEIERKLIFLDEAA